MGRNIRKEFERLRKGETDLDSSLLGHIHAFVGNSVRRLVVMPCVLIDEIIFIRDAE